jgi:hypothetical protein
MFTLSKMFQSFRRQTPSLIAESQLRAELAEAQERLANIDCLLEESCNHLYCCGKAVVFVVLMIRSVGTADFRIAMMTY